MEDKTKRKWVVLNGRAVTTYTAMCILREMKKRMGLEAMIEYQENYVRLIERYNPNLKMAVTRALAIMDVERMYKDARYEEHLR